ncbi:MAG TPA: YiiD C-terminal domain-containing protein [Fluviicoccus sp.]|nr:YiiD C-terminal domain-containing protein [Fluviicoccus sp.]
MKTTDDFADYLARHLPLSRAMQVRVDLYDGISLHLSAPLACNHNDKETAFAGSISSLASLSGWGLMMLWSEALGPCQAAIARADIHYRKPLLTDFRAIATLPDAAAIETFHRTFRERGRAKMPVTIEIHDAHGVGAVQEAVYAVWRLQDSV